ncbi:major sperm [Trichoderma arundinaceum]|uniref:Major sperm n=1 Tax=Trichoderma arundinaceum TaxID=490622 RepID=A0A395NMW5_TRIAR|nr:major sperm [Trichoderma arundinaceum]
MSVEIEPLELSFRRPFTVEVAQILKIKNPSSSPLAFKVKTTAPKQYCVRPNAGRIEPGQDFDVTVLLQAMKADPPLDAKCRDKFLVQSAPITADKEFASIASVLESTDKASIFERKIRVNWLAAGDSPDHGPSAVHPATATPSKQAAVNGSYDTPDAPRSYSSPSAADSPNAAPPPYANDERDDDESRPQTAKSVASKTASAVASTVQGATEDLKAKIIQLEAELANYKNGGLRQRNVKGSSDGEKSTAGAIAQQTKQVVEGVPVKIVAILCLISFLLAYIFF